MIVLLVSTFEYILPEEILEPDEFVRISVRRLKLDEVGYSEMLVVTRLKGCRDKGVKGYKGH